MAKWSKERKLSRRAARRTRVWWAVAGGLVLFVGWLVYSNPLPVGQQQTSAEPAPDVTLTTAMGDYRLSDQKGDLVVLYFSFVG